MISIDRYINQRVSPYSKIFELYAYESFDISTDTVYPEITRPSHIEVFVSDMAFNKLNAPSSLSVIDIWFQELTDFEFTINPNMEEVILINANIRAKTLTELFSTPKMRYKYVDCCLNGVPLNSLVNSLYSKYFQNTETIQTNIINHYTHTHTIRKIQDYEAAMLQGKAFCSAIKEELVSVVWHPDKVEKIINAYSIDFLDTL